jgi:hypothetical protein
MRLRGKSTPRAFGGVSSGLILNPGHIARRNLRRACVATRVFPLERRECGGALVGLLYGRNVDLASPFAKGRG